MEVTETNLMQEKEGNDEQVCYVYVAGHHEHRVLEEVISHVCIVQEYTQTDSRNDALFGDLPMWVVLRSSVDNGNNPVIEVSPESMGSRSRVDNSNNTMLGD